MNKQDYDVIIIGGSYSGLAAGMALGRAMRKVLIIDGGKPCNRQTPRSHNFITQDGKTPKEISALAKHQVEKYETVKFFKGMATQGLKTKSGFEIQTELGDIFNAKKLIFATGIKDLIPNIGGYSECWGITLLHCPYCHGFEVRNEVTGILGNGEYGFEFSRLISNWTKDITLYTNGLSTLTIEQRDKLKSRQINIIEKEIEKLYHKDGHLLSIIFKDGTSSFSNVVYTNVPFEQQSQIIKALGCEITKEGYIKIDAFQKTSIPGVFACGDNVSQIRTIANAVSSGTTAGMMLNKELIIEEF